MKGYQKEAGRIRNLLRARPRGMTITEISRSLGLNRNSVAKYLEILVTTGHVERQPVGRAKLYSLSQRVPLSAMLDLSSDMILVLDEQSRVFYVNDNLLGFEGRERWEIVGKAIRELSLRILSDPDILARIGTSGEQEFHKEVVIPGNTPGCFSVTPVSTILEDASRGITAIIKDITEQKRTEMQLKEHLFFFHELLDRIPTPVSYKDTRGLYMGCNRAFEEYTRRPRSQILGRKATEILPPELGGRFEEMDSLALETGTAHLLEPISPSDEDGKRHFVVFKAPFLDRDGAPAGIVGTIFEITDRKEAEEAWTC